MKITLAWTLGALLLLAGACALELTPPGTDVPNSLSPTSVIFDLIRNNQATATAQSQAPLPSRWDWRERGAVTAVKDQGDCGACYAFAAIANIESRLLIDGAGAFDLSENYAKTCTWEARNGAVDKDGNPRGGCAGGNYDMIANLFATGGMVLEACDPYSPEALACSTACPSQKTLLGWGVIEHDDVPNPDELKRAILEHGPVVASIYVGEDDLWRHVRHEYDGSYIIYYPLVKESNHDALVVGWDDSLEHAYGSGAWIVKESYGAQWGGTAGYGNERGYCTIAYGSAGIGKRYAYVTEWQDYDPQGELLYYDEAAWGGGLGFKSTEGHALARFTPTGAAVATRVEFWTTDRTVDVDVSIYDAFDGRQPATLLFDRENLSLEEAGYHSVPITPPLRLAASDEVVVVISLTNASDQFPIRVDKQGPFQPKRTYASPSGDPGTWDDLAEERANVGLRLRIRVSP